MTKRALHRLRVRGVDLERQREHTLQTADHLVEQRHLIDLRRADIDIEHVRARVLLLEALVHDVVDVVVDERLLEALLSGRVDAFANDDRTGRPSDFDGAGEGGDDGLFTALRREQWKRTDRGDLCADVVRGRAAAATDRGCTEFCDLLHVAGECLRVDVIDGAAVDRLRKTGVRVYKHRDVGGLHEALHDRDHLGRSERAVHAERIDAEALEHGDHRLRRTARQHLPTAVEDAGDENRQIAVFLRGKHSRLCFVRVVHRLDQHEIRTLTGTDPYDLAEDVDRVVEGEVAHRREQLAGRADVEGHVGILVTASLRARFLRKFYSGGHDFVEVLRELQAIRAESVRVVDVRTGLEIAAVQVEDTLRVEEIPGLRQLPRLQALLLQDGAGATVEEQPLPADSIHDILLHNFLREYQTARNEQSVFEHSLQL